MADPRTIIVPISAPAQTASYRLAPGVTQYIQSVVATVDTSASGDVTPVLTISEQSGVVVGDKQQTNAIAGGGSGRATWALGLADETPALSGFIRYHVQNIGDRLLVETTGGSGSQPVEMNFTAVNGQIELHADDVTRGDILMTSQFFHFFTPLADFRMLADGEITMSGDYYTIAMNGGEIDTSNTLFINLEATGKSLTVADHTGHPIFRVDESGALHGKTGQTLTFDL